MCLLGVISFELLFAIHLSAKIAFIDYLSREGVDMIFGGYDLWPTFWPLNQNSLETLKHCSGASTRNQEGVHVPFCGYITFHLLFDLHSSAKKA